ncbi:MAG: NADPH-dependent FMN reductase [Brevirhabdus sp.]
MTTPKLLGISGSLRADATNRKLIREAARVFGECDYTEAEIDLPLFNEDVEEAEGIPASVQVLADQIAEADAVVISTPEYNKGISGALKNALDWISRVKGMPWKDKPVAIMSAAAGRAGGERGQQQLLLCLAPFRANWVRGPEILVADSSNQFDEAGQLVNEMTVKMLTNHMAALRDAALVHMARDKG